jgi:pyruvate/2-oxoacid:ferredoxin oxidoreductase alpha subunit
MASSDTSSAWSEPRYVSTVVGVLATGAVVFYAAATQSGLTVAEVLFVLLSITLPATIAYEIARRWP